MLHNVIQPHGGINADPTASLAAVVGDEEVQREAERVKRNEAVNDLIVLSNVSKLRSVRTSTRKRAGFLSLSSASTSVQSVLDRVSFGVREGKSARACDREYDTFM